MTAATASFRLAELVTDQLRRSDANGIRLTNRAARLVRLVPTFRFFWSYPISRQLNRHALELAELAVWFRGAQAGLESEREIVDPQDSIRTLCDSCERRLMQIRNSARQIERLAQEVQDSRLAASASKMVVASADLYEAVRDFKSALQAHDADVSAREAAGKPGGQPATDAQSLEALLGRVFAKGE